MEKLPTERLSVKTDCEMRAERGDGRAVQEKQYEFSSVIEPVPDKGGAYVRVSFDIRKEFGKGRVKAEITFDGEPYSGSIVNMGVKNEDGSVCYIIGIRKDIRKKIGKNPGDTVRVTVRAAEGG